MFYFIHFTPLKTCIPMEDVTCSVSCTITLIFFNFDLLASFMGIWSAILWSQITKIIIVY